MKHLKHTLLILILSFTMFLLTACGIDTTAPKDRIEVKLWLIQYESYDVAWWKAQAQGFNESQDKYYAKITWVDSGAWDTKINSARESNSAPDVVMYSIGAIAQQAQYGTLLPINNYITDLSDYLADFDSKVVANITTTSGDVYGIPKFIEPSMLMYYRKDILSAAGWDQAPKTLDELDRCCTDVTNYLKAHKELKLSKTMQVASTNDDYGWVSWAVQYQLSGHESSLNADWTAANLEGYDKVAEYWADLHEMDGCAPQALTSGGYKDIFAAILEGKVAIQQCGSWIWGSLYSVEDYAPMIDKIGIAPWPTETGTFDGEILCSIGGWSLGIERGSHQPEGAAEFIKYCLLDPNGAERVYKYFEDGHFCKCSPRKSVNNLITSASTEESNAMRELLVNVLMNNSMMEPTYPWEISQFIGNQYVAFVSGGKTSQEAIRDAEEQINAYIKITNIAERRFN